MFALPFPYRADLLDNARNVVVAAVPLAWWPADVSKGRAGLDSDHTGEAPLAMYETIAQQVGSGYFLLDDGSRLQIRSASAQQFLQHTTMRLLRVVPHGA